MGLEMKGSKSSDEQKNNKNGVGHIRPINDSQSRAYENTRRVEEWRNNHRPIGTSQKQKGS
jgi:hypothetical protein